MREKGRERVRERKCVCVCVSVHLLAREKKTDNPIKIEKREREVVVHDNPVEKEGGRDPFKS